MLEFTHVPGSTRNRIVLYTLSTCGWCRKTKHLLEELGIGYDYVDVDLLEGPRNNEAKEDIVKWNPRCSFPTLVVNGEKCIVGFDEEEIRRLK